MIQFDGNRYSVPPQLTGTTVLVRANETHVRVFADGNSVTSHTRCYDRNQRLSLPEHRLAALKLRSRVRGHQIEEAFDALGNEARNFHLELRRQPVKITTHLRRIINLAHLYGREDVIHAITQANHWRTFDAAPRRTELLEETDLEEPDPAVYDHLTTLEEDLEHE